MQLHDTDPAERYETRSILGEGGMGEVLLCRDRRIGREVAMKVVLRSREAGAGLHARFLREARVQGQLEHPAIVPVYDLAKDTAGRSFFTMKRVRGDTLEMVIARLAGGDPRAAAEHTRHKLLAAYARVCLAVDFAHARGVVHRDLKPSNIMLGDFGEVYVLDWGVAKVEGAADDVAAPETLDESGERPCAASLYDVDGLATEAGIILGTPAYMPPEQLRGKPVDARTDVYALGAILFELLTLTSLSACNASGRATRDSVEHEANVQPELSAIWQKATARDPADRHASAREIHDAVESFLSGDRDLASRRALVETHLSAARAMTVETPENRSRALLEVGRAIALDPNDAEALRMLVGLLSDPPAEAPPEVLDELHRVREQSRRSGLKRAIFMYTGPALLFFLPAFVLMGVKSWACIILCLGSFLVAAAVAALAYFKNIIMARTPWVTVAASIAMATTAVLAGVYVLLPTFVITNTICHAMAGRREQRRTIIYIGVLALLIPIALELFGLVPSSHAFVDGSLVITSLAVDFREPLTPLFLMLANIGLLIFTSRYLGHHRDDHARAELRHLSHLWQLRQLVPERVRTATSDPPRSK